MRPWGNIEASGLIMEEAAVESGTDLLVLMAIAHETERDGPERGTGCPSVQRLEALTRLSTRSVQRRLPRLVEAGELEIDLKAGAEHTNVYRLPRLTEGPELPLAEPGVNLAAMHCVMLYSEAGGNDLLVQMAIARFSKASGKDKGKAYPGAGSLAALTRLSEKTVLTARRRLQRIGELNIAGMPSPYRTSICTIPMLQYRGVRSTEKLPVYAHIVSNDINSTTKGSYGVDLTPGTQDRLEREICIRLADHLIESGRKDPLYRTDAESFEWRSGAAYLHGGLTAGAREWLDDPSAFLDRLFRHVATSEQWPYVKHPRDVVDDLAEIVRTMKEAEQATGAKSNAEPNERSTRPQSRAFQHFTPQERTAQLQSLGLLHIHRDADGTEWTGSGRGRAISTDRASSRKRSHPGDGLPRIDAMSNHPEVGEAGKPRQQRASDRVPRPVRDTTQPEPENPGDELNNRNEVRREIELRRAQREASRAQREARVDAAAEAERAARGEEPDEKLQRLRQKATAVATIPTDLGGQSGTVAPSLEPRERRDLTADESDRHAAVVTAHADDPDKNEEPATLKRPRERTAATPQEGEDERDQRPPKGRTRHTSRPRRRSQWRNRPDCPEPPQQSDEDFTAWFLGLLDQPYDEQ